MQLTVRPDLESLINKRLSSGNYASPKEVLRSALEAQDTEESYSAGALEALSAQIEEGYQQSDRGELIDSAQTQLQIRAMKADRRPTSRAYQAIPDGRRVLYI